MYDNTIKIRSFCSGGILKSRTWGIPTAHTKSE